MLNVHIPKPLLFYEDPGKAVFSLPDVESILLLPHPFGFVADGYCCFWFWFLRQFLFIVLVVLELVL